MLSGRRAPRDDWFMPGTFNLVCERGGVGREANANLGGVDGRSARSSTDRSILDTRTK